MLKEKLKNLHIILASGSPRRKKFFEDMGINFEIRIKSVEEVYPEYLRHSEIPIYLAELKAQALKEDLKANEILVTSDTIVWHDNVSIGKPKDLKEAGEMLRRLSGDIHEVITAVCFTSNARQLTVYDTTEVGFKDLTEEEIQYYLTNCKPLDKAGAYGIQEWIGLIGIEELKGSYYNVMGLPTHLVYKTLMHMVN